MKTDAEEIKKNGKRNDKWAFLKLYHSDVYTWYWLIQIFTKKIKDIPCF